MKPLPPAVRDKMADRARQIRIRLDLKDACDRGDLLAAARVYAELGWAIFPVYEVDESAACACGNPECGSPGKHPRVPHGVKEASTDPAIVRQWWHRWPRANIGIATGEVSGLIVLDQDGPEGAETLKGSPLPWTPIVRTGRPAGRHFYFSYPS